MRARLVSLIAGSALVAALGMGATEFVVERRASGQQTAAQKRIDERADELADAVGLAMRLRIESLRSAARFATASAPVARDRWESFAGDHLTDTVRGIRSVSYIARVPGPQLQAYVAAQKADGAPEFDVRDAAAGDDHAVVQMVSPADPSVEGIDLAADPARYEALRMAMYTGQPTLSQPVVLPIGQGVPTDALPRVIAVYVPVYRTGEPLYRPADREDSLIGWVSSSLRVEDFVALTPTKGSDVVVELYDGVATSPQAFLGRSAPLVPGSGPPLLSDVRTEVLGRPWTLRVIAAPGFAPVPQTSALRHFGWALSALLGLIAYMTSTRRLRLQRAVSDALARAGAAESRFSAAFTSTVTGMAVFSADGTLVDANAALAAMVGAEREDLVGARPAALVDPGIAALVSGAAARSERDITLVGADGSETLLRAVSSPIKDGSGEVTGIVAHYEDVTLTRSAQEALRTSEERKTKVFDALQEGIVLFDASGGMLDWNRSAEEILQIAHDDFGPFVAGGLGPRSAVLSEDGEALPSSEFPIARALRDGVAVSGEILCVQRGDGTRTWLSMNAFPLFDPDVPGKVAGAVGSFVDVTEQRAAEAAAQASEARLAWLAFHDTLTGLPNRALLMDRLGQALHKSRRAGDAPALLYVDLDRFKGVNDSQGHEAGDRLLVEAARRLTRVVRGGDTVARIGGDEFVVLVDTSDANEPGPAEDAVPGAPTMAEHVARRIIAAFDEPILLPAGPVSISASIGIAYDTDHRPETLLRNADTALYRAKENGKNCYEVYDAGLGAAAVRRIEAEQLLRTALDESTLAVHYQPIIDLTTGVVVSAEALLRVPGPDGRLRPPREFIAVAEESGLIVTVGAGVLDDACERLAAWRRRRPLTAPGHISVNVSARQLAAEGFVQVVSRAVRIHGLQPSDLVLELTESTVIAADPASTRAVTELHELGVTLALDDFGTGFSSLVYLKRFPIDQVKLDRTFVAGLGRDPNDTEIVKAVISLGRSLGLLVVAEGIETERQYETLKELGCDRGQGFLFAKAAPADELELLRL